MVFGLGIKGFRFEWSIVGFRDFLSGVCVVVHLREKVLFPH